MPTDDKPEGEKAAAFAAKPLPVMEGAIPSVVATRLLRWHRLGDIIWLTFAEERSEVLDEADMRLHVVSRIAMPLSSLDSTIEFLLNASQTVAAANAPPASSALN